MNAITKPILSPIQGDTTRVMLRSLARFIAPMIEEHGRGIAFGFISYPRAFDRLMSECRWRGAGFLDESSEAEFEDWLHRRLIAAIDYSEGLNERIAEALNDAP